MLTASDEHAVDNQADASSRPVERVLVLANWFPSDADPGLGSFVLEQVRALRDASALDVRVVSGRPLRVSTLNPLAFRRTLAVYRRAFHTLDWSTRDGVPVLEIPYLVGTPIPVVSNALTYRRAVARVADQVRENFEFDLVHAHTAFLDGTAGAMLARRYHTPLVITEHSGPFAQLTRRPWIRWQVKKTLRAADRVFGVSEALADEIRSLLASRSMRRAERDLVQTMPNGVDTTLFHPAEPARAANPAAPRIFAVGVLHEVKNPLLLVEAFARVHARLPRASLHIVSGGALEGAARERCAQLGVLDSVVWHGFQPRREVARLLRDECDLLAMSSSSETFGIVAIEAMACGKPVVSTRCGGPESIVTQPFLGQLCENGDPHALATAMLDVISRLGEFDAQRIRAHAVAHYDFDKVATAIDAAYRALSLPDTH